MTNIINLLIALVATCLFSLWMLKYKKDKLRTWMVVVMFFASYPYRFGNDILSLWGGINPEGSVYSLCPIYVDAKDLAYGIFSIGYLNGGEDAIQLIGIGYLNGGNNAVQVIGIGYLNAVHTATQIIGIGYINGGENADQILGGIGYLNGGRNAVQGIGLGIQIAEKGDAVLGFGIPLYQKGDTFTGISWEKAIASRP